MPQAIAYVLAAVFTAGVVTTAITVASYAIFLVGTLALSSYQQRKAERAARAAHDSSVVDRMANVATTVAARELVMGRIRKGGNVFFRGSTGAFKERFVTCITLAAHEIDAVEQVYFNDVPIVLDVNGDVLSGPYGLTETISGTEPLTGTATTLANTPIIPAAVARGTGPVVTRTQAATDTTAAQTETVTDFTVAGNVLTLASYDSGWAYTVAYQYSRYSPFANVRWYLGAPGQQADVHLQQLFPGSWTTAHQARGVAYLICEFIYNETAFPNGLPLITALVRGAKLYDPRTTLTVFSENPALMMRHALTHPQFGKRTSISAAEDARIAAAANACETVFNYGEGNVSLYRAAIVVPFGAPARDVMDDLSQSMGGQWAYAAGEFFVRAGVYQAPVMSLTDADLAVVQRGNDGSINQKPISISTHRARNEKINTVVARIWDQASSYQQTPITPCRADAYVAADGVPLVQEVTMPAVFYGYQAYHIAGIMLRDSRDPLTVTLPFKLRAYPLEMFDSVTLTLARYGWSAKEFQILGRSFLADGVVQLTLKETAAPIYQYGAGFVPSGYASNTLLPQPWNITAPQITSLTSSESDLIVQSDGTVINGVRVVWTPSQDGSVINGGSIEIQYQALPDATWRSTVVSGGDTQATFSGVPDGALVVVRVRARNSLATSDWSAHDAVTASGKAAPPPDIINLSIAGSVLSWSMPYRPLDLAGFAFRFHYGNNLDWNSATPLHNGLLTQSPFDLVTRPGGAVTIMGKAVDTSGNESNATANVVMNLGDPPIANIVEQWNFDALGWPYVAAESSGWTLVSGDPSANALDSFYGTDDQSLYGGTSDSFYGPSAYGQMIFVTTEISVVAALVGSVMTLQQTTQGIDLRIDYRLAGPGSFYGPDTDSFYGDDADPLYGPPGSWLPWPGQILAARDAYQFRVTIGASVARGILQGLIVTIDAPDLEESLADVAVANTGTAIPYTKAFTAIKTVQATLQSNGSGAETVEIDKTAPLTPVIRAFNSGHTAVSGATADIVLRGY